jgi:uncharacterized iron-regulated membrane protein
MASPATPEDPGGIRPALNWVHTWFGLIAGGLLFLIFWMGTLSVFDWEIDRWMMPATRHAAPAAFSVDAFRPIAERAAPTAETWSVMLPTDRSPAQFRAHLKDESNIDFWIDPQTNLLLPDQGTLGGTGFFYPYHYTLHISAFNIGLILCALAGVLMMVLCVSGVIIHRHIFADFFTFRASRKTQRSVLDLHNLTGVLALPFHFVIALSGVALFTIYYLPTAQGIVFQSDPASANEGYFFREAAGRPGGDAVSLDEIVADATRRWDGVRPGMVAVFHPGDANEFVEVRWPLGATLAARYHSIWYDGDTGELLYYDPPSRASAGYAVLWGLHVIQFDHLVIRWLYFFSGLAGCVLIGTGMLFWAQSRRKRHARTGSRGAAIVEAITIATTTGLILATLAFLIANRLLPAGSIGRAATEAWIFHIAWLAALLHAALRGRKAWLEQSAGIAIGCVIAVILNAATTGDIIPIAIARGQWGVAGIDLALLSAAMIAAYAALRLARSPGSRNLSLSPAPAAK